MTMIGDRWKMPYLPRICAQVLTPLNGKPRDDGFWARG